MATPELDAQRKMFEEGMAKLGVGKERSGFLTTEKYNEIVDCLLRWESTEKGKRREIWSHGYTWVAKYTLLQPAAGDPFLLIYTLLFRR